MASMEGSHLGRCPLILTTPGLQQAHCSGIGVCNLHPALPDFITDLPEELRRGEVKGITDQKDGIHRRFLRADLNLAQVSSFEVGQISKGGLR